MEPGGLFPNLLGTAWTALPASVRELHEGRARIDAHGRARVDGDPRWPARAARRLLGLPPPGGEVPLEVAIVPSPEGELWLRRFANRIMRSRLNASATCTDAFDERLGPARLTFSPVPDAGRLRWITRELRLCGLRLPLRWAGGVRASCGERDGRYDFDIAVTLPGLGLLVAYAGWLEVGDGRG